MKKVINKNSMIKLKGGIAIPLDKTNKLFYLYGAKHEQGGIDITPELEAEGGEVVKINPKSIKVVTAQKIMGGKSPAELVVDASSTGKSEKVFNKVFGYQEKFKDRHNLNDDGTKKAKWGILEKIKNSKVGKRILDHLKFETFFDNAGYDSNIIPIDNQIANGEYELYPNAQYTHYNREHFYKKDNKIVYDDNWNYDRRPEYMQYRGYEPLNYDELRKMLPKRDYIGGSKRDVGMKVINKVPGMKDEILRLSEVYGISPNVFTQRLINEGWVQDQAKMYNRASVKDQKNYNWNKMNDFVDGFSTLGLDTFGNHHKAGHLNLRRDIKYDDRYTTNEDGTGRIYNSAEFNNMYDALEAKAAMIEYLTKLGKNKGHTGSDLDAWVNAAYNMGEYHKDLNNMNYVRRKYGVKPYYRYGGEMKNKKKASHGILYTRDNIFGDRVLVDTNIGYELPIIPTIGIYADDKFKPEEPKKAEVVSRTEDAAVKDKKLEKSIIDHINGIRKNPLKFDYLNEITYPDGSVYNVRTGQRYYPNWNKIRTNPYSTMDLTTGEITYDNNLIDSNLFNTNYKTKKPSDTVIKPSDTVIKPSNTITKSKPKVILDSSERLLNVGDWVNIGSNSLVAATNLVTGLLTPDVKYAKLSDPVPIIAPKINSNVNTTAEESATEEAYNDEIRSINENTADSKTALNRKRKATLRKRNAKVAIRSNAENIKRDLINEGNKLKSEYDRYNLVRQDKVDLYNANAESAKYNANRTKLSDAFTGFVSDLTGGASTIINAIEERQKDKLNTANTYAAYPNINPTEFNKGRDEIYEGMFGKRRKANLRTRKSNKK